MSSTAVRRAVIVGVNRYKNPAHNLLGCVNDALMVGGMLMEEFDFEKEDIRLVVDERATGDNIRARLAWLVDGAGPGSVLVFHFSGHGSQVRDREGDELDDGMDEIICPHDMNWDDPFTDDELAAVVGSVAEGVNFTLILDCCHSGTGTREVVREAPAARALVPRFMAPPPDIAFRLAAGVHIASDIPERTVNLVGYQAGLTRRAFGTAVVQQNGILITGCRADQTSADAWIDNDHFGAASYSLNYTLRQHRFDISYLDLVREAGAWLTARGYSQEPQLEGPEPRFSWKFLAAPDTALRA